MMTQIKIVTTSGQVFNSKVLTKDLCPAFQERQPDFEGIFVMDTDDNTKNPIFMINGKHVESITLLEVEK